jgi:hypothetical protein
LARAGYEEANGMTSGIRKALAEYKRAKSEEEDFRAEEKLCDALLAWRKEQVAMVIKQCIRIATECQNRDVSTADIILDKFKEAI